jgi:hypothetical protein
MEREVNHQWLKSYAGEKPKLPLWLIARPRMRLHAFALLLALTTLDHCVCPVVPARLSAAEQTLRTFLQSSLIKIEVFSVLKPIHDYRIYNDLKRYPEILPDIHRCVRHSHQQGSSLFSVVSSALLAAVSAQLQHHQAVVQKVQQGAASASCRNHVIVCFCICSQCAYVWVNLMARFGPELLDPIFQVNLFDDPDLQKYWCVLSLA